MHCQSWRGAVHTHVLVGAVGTTVLYFESCVQSNCIVGGIILSRFQKDKKLFQSHSGTRYATLHVCVCVHMLVCVCVRVRVCVCVVCVYVGDSKRRGW